MYVTIKESNGFNTEGLTALAKELTFRPVTSHRRRMGLNKFNALSQYSNTKYLTWTASQRSMFKDNFNKEVMDKTLVNWFVRFDPEVGFLDKMVAWVGEKSPAWLTIFVIEGKATVMLGEETIEVNKGGGLHFPLSYVHSVEKNQEGCTLACAMTMDQVLKDNT